MGHRRMRQFIKCDSVPHAEAVDALILDRLREVYGNRGSCWSGIWAKAGPIYGVYWGNPASAVFGHTPSEEHPDGDPALVIIDEVVDADGNSDWTLVVPEVIVSEEI